MKRATRKVEKRTFTLKNAIPRFVSIVTRGANFTPLAELRYADGTERFSDVEINQIVFSKESFSREGVEQYLQENDYEDFKIEETELAYVVPGVEEAEFEEVSPIEYGDGVQFFVGKLKTPTDTDQATTEVTSADILDFSEQEIVQEGASETALEQAEQEIAAEAEAEVVQEGDLSVEDLKPKTEEVTVEEANSEGEATASQEGASSDETGQEPQEQEVVQEGEPETVDTTVEDTPIFNEVLFREKATEALDAFFAALEAAKTDSFAMPEQVEEVTTYTQEQVDAMIAEAIEAANAQFADKNEETAEITIDETPIVVQNSQAVLSEEITTEKFRDERAEKFAQSKSNDLFGLRK